MPPAFYPLPSPDCLLIIPSCDVIESDKTTSTGQTSEDSSTTSKCRPWNYQDFLQRLASFNKTQDWFAKPDELSAVQAALHGWYNTKYNVLHCYACNTDWEHVEGKCHKYKYIF